MSVYSSDDWSLPSISSAICFIYGLSLRLNSVFLSFSWPLYPFQGLYVTIHPPHPMLLSHPRPPSYSLPVSPLSVDFSTSETKQTQSCVSGLVTLRALLAQCSCVLVPPAIFNILHISPAAPVPFACSGLTSRPCGTPSKQDTCSPGTETCPPSLSSGSVKSNLKTVDESII